MAGNSGDTPSGSSSLASSGVPGSPRVDGSMSSRVDAASTQAATSSSASLTPTPCSSVWTTSRQVTRAVSWIRPGAKKPKGGGDTTQKPPPATKWAPLFSDQDVPYSGKKLTHEQLIDSERKKKRLLSIVRAEAPVDTIFRVWLLGRTVLPRLLHHPVVWLNLVAFGGSAACRRLGIFDTGWVVDEASSSGSGNLVTFMIVFYVGYCYNRNHECFMLAEKAMDKITTLVAEAHVAMPQEEGVRLWRQLTLMHITAYTGLSPTYDRENVLDAFVAKFDLISPGSQEEAQLQVIDVDAEGDRAWKTCMLWALETLHAAADRGDLSPPVHAHMVRELHDACSSFTALYTMQFEALPFIYTHLVSLSCAMFLLSTAVVKGMYFTPEALYISGLVLPLISLLTMAISAYGLMEVADTIIDPFGDDPEDLAVVAVLESTTVATLNMLHIPCARTDADREKDAAAAQKRALAAAVTDDSRAAASRSRRASHEAADRGVSRQKMRSPREKADASHYSRDRPPPSRNESRGDSRGDSRGERSMSRSQSRSASPSPDARSRSKSTPVPRQFHSRPPSRAARPEGRTDGRPPRSGSATRDAPNGIPIVDDMPKQDLQA